MSTDDLDPIDDLPEIQPDPEESEAAKYGWKPKDQFTLAPDGWVEASKFLTMPSTQLKIARDTQRDMKRELDDVKARAERAERMSTTVADRVREQERVKYEADLAAIRQQQRSAAEIGDVTAFDALESQRQKMAPPPVVDANEPPPEIKKLFDTYSWTKDREVMAFGFNLINETPGLGAMSPERQFAVVDAKAREFFPDKFPAVAARAASRVDGGGLGGIGMKQTYAARLPADVAKAGQQFVKQGIFKDIEEYARDYFEE